MLRTQLATLAQLATVALGLMAAAGTLGFEAAAPMTALAALEKAIRREARIAWAMRLLAALRAKLTDDLHRVERGEDPDRVLAAEAPAPAVEAEPSMASETVERAEPAERRERLTDGRDRERFSLLPRHAAGDEFAEILKRPTEEVIALIREALGVEAEASGDAPRGGQGRAFDAPAAETPDYPPRGFRPPRAPPCERPSLT